MRLKRSEQEIGEKPELEKTAVENGWRVRGPSGPRGQGVKYLATEFCEKEVVGGPNKGEDRAWGQKPSWNAFRREWKKRK